MKKNTIKMLVVMMVLWGTPSFASLNNVANTEPSKAEESKAAVLIERLEQIDKIDKTDMTFPEKRELRKEVKSIQRELDRAGGGVYISVGAVIVILLLLIILL